MSGSCVCRKEVDLKLKKHYGRLNGYTDEAQAVKDQFLHDAKRLLTEAGKRLAKMGLPNSEISINQSGTGSSGDVYAHFWNAEQPGYCAYCTITALGLGPVVIGERDKREDGLTILIRKDEWKEEPHKKATKKTVWRAGKLGINRYVPTDYDDRAMADALKQVFETGDFSITMYEMEYARQQPEDAPASIQLSLFGEEVVGT